MKIISNTAVSLDGKITTHLNERYRFGSDEDLRRMAQIRAQADAILIGGNSFRTWPDVRIMTSRHENISQQSRSILFVIVSRLFDFKGAEESLKNSGVTPLFLMGPQVKTSQAKTSQVKIPPSFPFEVVSSALEITPHWIIDELAKRGVKTLLIEAGGELLFPFLQAELIDEMHVTLCPLLIGGKTAPSLVGGGGFDKNTVKKLGLIKQETVGSEIFLHYKVLRFTGG